MPFATKENEENWLWFLSKLINNFPGSKCILGNFDKGLQSHSIADLLANNNIKFSRCVFGTRFYLAISSVKEMKHFSDGPMV